MAPGLAQKELKRVGGGLVGERRRWIDRRGDLGLILGYLDSALLQLAVEAVNVVSVEVEELRSVEHFAGADRARVLSGVEKVSYLLTFQESVRYRSS